MYFERKRGQAPVFMLICVFFLPPPHFSRFFPDINECSDSSDTCDATSGICTNTPGGYTCACQSGYVGNGFTCTGTWRTLFLDISKDIVVYQSE